jgi:hypothetical protein
LAASAEGGFQALPLWTLEFLGSVKSTISIYPLVVAGLLPGRDLKLRIQELQFPSQGPIAAYFRIFRHGRG